jgi:predicted transcriptional regulator
MDRKQREALIVALSEKGKTYREITKEAGVSPNTIKAILNKAGLDQTTSISSRVFELYSQDKTPLEIAITLGLKSEDAIRYHQEYFMLLGCYEFTKIYLQIKDNPWPYVNLVKLAQNSGMGDGEVVELLKIANGHLPRVKLEYDRLNAELNSLKAEISNSVRIYQDFCDRNVGLKNREDELQLTISKLEGKIPDLQKTRFNESLSQFQENDADITNLNPEVKQEDVISTNDVSIPPRGISLYAFRSRIPFFSSCLSLIVSVLLLNPFIDFLNFIYRTGSVVQRNGIRISSVPLFVIKSLSFSVSFISN